MSRHHVRVTADVAAPSAAIYDVIADYRNGHPQILPEEHFRGLDVEQGGRGEGTIIRFRMRVLGKTRAVRSKITEPVPGRVLVEKEIGGETETTFTVEPSGGVTSRVTISTELMTRKGVAGWVERFVATRVLERIYHKELALLSVVARQRTS